MAGFSEYRRWIFFSVVVPDIFGLESSERIPESRGYFDTRVAKQVTTRFRLDDENMAVVTDKFDVQLLPREYLLLRFLCQHPNRTFSRDELLDAVWEHDSPVDRTVDDHVYRLRKKLSSLSNQFVLETVRGHGYRLRILSVGDTQRRGAQKPGPIRFSSNRAVSASSGTRPTISPEALQRNPLLRNADYRDHIRSLFRTYVLHGTGNGITAMFESPDVFGIQLDARLYYRSRFIQGDYAAIIEDHSLPQSDSLFWLLGLYEHVQFDYESSLTFYERAIDKYLLRFEDHLEVVTFNLPMLYLYTGQRDKAVRAMSDSITSCSAMPDFLDGYAVLVRLCDAVSSLHLGDTTAALEKLRLARKTVTELPWQRETGYMKLIEGMFAYAVDGDHKAAERQIDAGLQYLLDIGFVNHYISRLQEVVHFFRQVYPSPSLLAKYEKIWDEVSEARNFLWLSARVKEKLMKILPI